MTEDTTDKKKLEDELDVLKSEMAELKEMMANNPQRTTSKSFHSEPEFHFTFEEDFDDFSDTLDAYMEGIMAGVAEKIRSTMEQFSDGFMGAGERMKMNHQVRHMNREAKRAARAASKFGKSIRYKPLTEEEEELFYELAPSLTGALSDTRRLKLLRELEKGPKYQGDLSEITDLKGGTFKHHMDVLMDLGFVYQEASRGRYLIKQLGIEALKLSELLFRRHTTEIKEQQSDEQESIQEEEPDQDDEDTFSQDGEEDDLNEVIGN